MKPYERLLKYIAIRTPSDEESTTVPSSACQFELAQHLLRELFTMGITDAKVDTMCYLYAHIPPTPGYEDRPRLGFIAHLDTVSEFCDRRSTKITMAGIFPSARAGASSRRICFPISGN